MTSLLRTLTAVTFLLTWAAQAQSQTDIDLHRVIHGTVVDREGAGVPDAIVQLCTITEDPETGTEYHPIVAIISDAHGIFAFPQLDLVASVKYSIRVLAPNGGRARYPLEQSYIGTADKPAMSLLSALPSGPHFEKPTKPPPKKYATTKVFYGTNRKQAITSKATYMNEPDTEDKLSVGVCEVAVHIDSQESGLPLLKYLGSWTDRFYTVQSLKPLSAEEWKHELSSTDGSTDALLFIHGYNTSFDESCRRAAQLAYDIRFSGRILLYSWPSADRFFLYTYDEEMARLSKHDFVQFLNMIGATPGIRRVHIVAHSMGNRLLVAALDDSDLGQPFRTRLGKVVFAAPDENVLIFHQNVDKANIEKTMYASDHDLMLQLSKIFHDYKRAGDAKPVIEILKGGDSIDASAADTSLLGHSYVDSSQMLITDLHSLIINNEAPDQRVGLSKDATGVYWRLQPKH